jgi:hypothetical protein
MGMSSLLKMLCAACLVAACSRGPDPQPKPPEKTAFDPLLEQERRARDVQNTADAAASRARQAIDAQERGDSPP